MYRPPTWTIITLLFLLIFSNVGIGIYNIIISMKELPINCRIMEIINEECVFVNDTDKTYYIYDQLFYVNISGYRHVASHQCYAGFVCQNCGIQYINGSNHLCWIGKNSYTYNIFNQSDNFFLDLLITQSVLAGLAILVIIYMVIWITLPRKIYEVIN